MKAWRIAAVCVALVALLAVPRTAVAQDDLRIARVSRSVGSDAEVVVSVPRALSGRTLAPSAFTVTVDGSPVTATATRLIGRGFDIALVIESSTSATEEFFVAAKAAAVEFILQQPVDTRVALVASDPPAVTLGFTADRAALVGAIKTLARAPGDGLVTALGLAARLTVSQPVTIIAAATAADATANASALRDDRVASLRSGPSQLFAVGAVSAPLAQLAADSGGFARNADARQLVGAFDSVSSDLAGRYGLTFPVSPNAAHLEIRVTAPEGTSSASVALSSGAATNTGTAATTSPATTSPSADNGIGAARSAGDANRSPALGVALVIGLIAVVLLAVFFFDRSRRRRQLLPWDEAAAPSPAALFPAAAASPPRPPPPPPLPTIDLRPAARLPLAGYALTALCDDVEIIELRAAVEPTGIVVSQAHTVDEALRDVVAGRAKALYVDSGMSHARELATAVRQRNDAGWSSCPTLVHDSHRGPTDPALMAVADAIIVEPIDASRVVAALSTRRSPRDETPR